MANYIETAAVIQKNLDTASTVGLSTGWMDKNAGKVKYSGGREIKIPKVDMDGIAEEENTPILGGVATMGFGDSIKYLKRGLKVARTGWNGKGMFLFLVNVTEFETDADMTNFMQSEEKFSMPNVVAMKTADNNIVVGWLASQTDMLAEDWMIVD